MIEWFIKQEHMNDEKTGRHKIFYGLSSINDEFGDFV